MLHASSNTSLTLHTHCNTLRCSVCVHERKPEGVLKYCDNQPENCCIYSARHVCLTLYQQGGAVTVVVILSTINST